MAARLLNLRRAGFQPTGAIDGGAFHGEWTSEFWQVWANVPVLLVEPQPQCRTILEKLASPVAGSKVASCALGEYDGNISFALQETNSGVRPDIAEADSGNVQVPMTTLSSLLRQSSKFSPNFLKLDLQGYELPALRGGLKELSKFEVVLLEISILRIGEVPIFDEVNQFLQDNGFRLYDLIPQYYRPKDGALWQIDAFYTRENSELIASRDWN